MYICINEGPKTIVNFFEFWNCILKQNRREDNYYGLLSLLKFI